MKRPVAVQLWSVFALAQEDFPGVLRQVSEIGYDGPAILAANPAVAWHIVELDRCDTDVMTALRESRGYLASLFV
jgi:hypothetical protein